MTGKEMKRFREEIGLTQTEFGSYLGYKHPQTQISNIENSKRSLNLRLASAVKMWIKTYRGDHIRSVTKKVGGNKS